MSSVLSGPPEQVTDSEKRSYVRDMFTAIAPRYDLLNHVLSLNIDRRWRRRAIERLDWQRSPDGLYLDLCAGTLDLAAELGSRPGFTGRIVGADFVVPMLQLGRGKATGIHPVGGDALNLPFPAGCFDGCTVGFGIRNLADIDAGLTEIARVLKPGGRLIVLEFSTPTSWPTRPLYLFYFRHVLPFIGRVVSKHMTAYSYLPDSVAGFPDNDGFTRQMSGAGFDNVGFEQLTLGVASLYSGVARGK
ncbi:MAG: ubiquinone/menaquinone biosynthesis methyltransferase [Gemmatimonadota bacterium]|nr:MAG: ubiquinone/menaquinone biosynthesis methyltransferase [Gemmatimonadota bacterium]